MTETRPITCALTGIDFKDRLAWIEELTRDALRGYERAGLSLTLRYAAHAKQRVEELVRKEQACCSFLSFKISELADELWLTIKAPEDAPTTVNALFEPFLLSAACARSYRSHRGAILSNEV